MLNGIRTDLAREVRELHPELEGVLERNWDNGRISISHIDITTQEAARSLGKRMGTYITLDAPELPLKPPGIAGELSREIARQLGELIKDIPKDADVLVVGLGNRAITPDSLGPKVVDSIYVTRHIKLHMPEAIPEKIRGVSAIAPGVLGITGVETIDIIRGVVEHTHPSLVLAVDSLASRRAARIGTTVQLTDTGISPGAGIGNNRSGLNRESLGVPVIALGVPLVVYAGTIARDTIGLIADETGLHGDEDRLKKLADKVIEEHMGDLIVTPNEIDSLVTDMTRVISNGINIALFGEDYAAVRSLSA